MGNLNGKKARKAIGGNRYTLKRNTTKKKKFGGYKTPKQRLRALRNAQRNDKE